MKWITRERMGVDRCACAWLIRTHIDKEAAFSFVPVGTDPATLDGHTFDMLGAEFGHESERCSFETLIARHDLGGDAALVEMGRIIRDADVPPARTRRPEAPGLDALLVGFAELTPDDYAKIEATEAVFNALYQYCQAKIREQAEHPKTRRTPRPQLRHSKRVADHLRDDS